MFEILTKLTIIKIVNFEQLALGFWFSLHEKMISFFVFLLMEETSLLITWLKLYEPRPEKTGFRT